MTHSPHVFTVFLLIRTLSHRRATSIFLREHSQYSTNSHYLRENQRLRPVVTSRRLSCVHFDISTASWLPLRFAHAFLKYIIIERIVTSKHASRSLRLCRIGRTHRGIETHAEIRLCTYISRSFNDDRERQIVRSRGRSAMSAKIATLSSLNYRTIHPQVYTHSLLRSTHMHIQITY